MGTERYALVFGSLLIPVGRFADKYGRKQSFIVGRVIFTLASLACALIPDLWVLVAFRCVQAVGADNSALHGRGDEA
jgi:MFS family permease